MTSLTKRQAAILLGVVLLVVLAGWLLYQSHAAQEARLQKATLLTEHQAQSINALENELKISKQNAELLAKAVAEAKAGQRQPEVRYIVQAPTVQAAAEKVSDQINKQDKTLPPLALEKTDRTLVTVNEQKTPQTNWDVGVFKVNNYRNWEWSTGYGQHGGDKYVPVEIQRNYSKDAALSYEHHFGGQSGWEVKYTGKTDKLFFLF